MFSITGSTRVSLFEMITLQTMRPTRKGVGIYKPIQISLWKLEFRKLGRFAYEAIC